MPEHDGGPGPGDVRDVVVAKARSARVTFESDRVATVTAQGVNQRPVAGAHIEHRSGRSEPVDPSSQAGAGTTQERVADPAESTSTRPVPVAVRRL